MAEVIEARQKFLDGLIGLGEYLALLNRFLDGVVVP